MADRVVHLHFGSRIELVPDAALYPTICAACRDRVAILSDGSGGTLIVDQVPGLPPESYEPHVRPHCCAAVIGGEVVDRAFRPLADQGRAKRAARHRRLRRGGEEGGRN